MIARKVSILMLLLSCACHHAETARAQSLVQDPPIRLRASQHFGSQALVCNGVAGLVLERGSFLAQLLGWAQLNNTVHRISLDATTDIQFNISAILRPSELADRVPYIWAFTSSPSGEVFVLTRWLKPHVSDVTDILKFDSQGVFEGIIPMEIENVQVLHMARFRDGRFILIAGKMGGAGFKSVDAAFFDAEGKLLVRKPLRELSDAEEGLAKKQQEQLTNEQMHVQAKSSTQSSPLRDDDGKGSPSSAPPVAEVKQPGQEMFALVSHTLLTSDDDGTMYMVRPDKPGVIYRVTSDAAITEVPLKKAAHVDSTVSAANTQLINAIVSAGQLILFYSTYDAAPSMTQPYHVVGTSIKTYDLFDGEPTGTYVGDPTTNGIIPAGWSKEGASYLRYSKSIQPPGVEIILSSR